MLDQTHLVVSKEGSKKLKFCFQHLRSFWKKKQQKHLGLFIPNQYYQVALNDSWKWFWDAFLCGPHLPHMDVCILVGELIWQANLP